jgi:hypothetical protein
MQPGVVIANQQLLARAWLAFVKQHFKGKIKERL